MSLKCLIVDDENIARKILSEYVSKVPELELVASCSSALQALNYIKNDNIDVLFLDIQMPDLDGISFLTSLTSTPSVIFTTAYDQYALKGYELEIVDYLLKPISFERFSKAITRFENLENKGNQHTLEPSFFVKEGDEFIKILVKDIDYIEGLKDYAKIVTGKNYCLALKTLKSIEDVLRPYNFMRIHKSYIAPLSKIRQYNGKCILINHSEIPVGSRYREALKLYLHNNKL